MGDFDYSDLIGAPFAYGGRGPKEYDCYGLLIEIYRRSGIRVPDHASSDDRSLIEQWVNEELRLWEECDPFRGAAMLVRVQGLLCHVGICLGNDRFLHTWEGTGGVCVERLSLWGRRVRGFYRFIGT